jgi:hypothetical protein
VTPRIDEAKAETEIIAEKSVVEPAPEEIPVLKL